MKDSGQSQKRTVDKGAGLKFGRMGLCTKVIGLTTKPQVVED